MVNKSNSIEEKRLSTANSLIEKKSGRADVSRPARGRKNTFWNQIRVNANLTYADVADYLHLGMSTVAKFFTGQMVPLDAYIDKLCELFEVDRIQGEREFIKANREWDTIHDGKKHDTFSAKTEKEEPKTTTPEKKVVIKKSTVIYRKEESEMDIAGLNRLVYGILDYDDFVSFTKLLASRKTYESDKYFKSDVKEFIGQRVYGKVDFETFGAIYKLIE